ncbi:MOSC domain protein [Aspergillus sclerotioniger CBS 115572]|uniref:MOSC domain protein n=1 Tax=Aspergillus sclerotioniger CBS 115572 TaxID=1450535 RepID=A0A317X6Z8_9EURO|nr:MOSC domain protein [Aspergillus sclerotioniger CBS 115572]PWY93327.1 MOSC domain protein [Aspergillus sclerotioniger CBS 115572]
MQIGELYTYPIKSLQGITLSTAELTARGFPYDRRFMLLKVVYNDDGTSTKKNMHVPHFPEMSLFYTDLIYPSMDGAESGRIIVTYRPPDHAKSRTLEVPLQPDTRGLEELAIVMHQSPTKGYNMGERYNGWFSKCFGYEVVLAYLGPHSRGVLGSFAPEKSVAHMSLNNSWVSMKAVGGLTIATLLLNWVVGPGEISVREMLPSLAATVVAVLLLGWTRYGGGWARKGERITFADTAPYLLVSRTSVADVSARLTGDEEMDVTKFRPNIVVAGAQTAFEEDFWAELKVGQDQGAGEGLARLLLTANCVRCQSLNVDYATGKMGTGETGTVLKKLMKDRRVDKGARFSPVFGRYVFLDGKSDGQTVRVGDAVVVARRIEERMVYDWPGLTN